MTYSKQLSIIIPAYNEAESLTELHRRLKTVIESYDYEIIFIDDGSTDNTATVLKEIRAGNNNVKIIQLKRNFGKSTALSVGFGEASGALVVTMDADLQDEPNEIPHLISKIREGYDLVSGWKKDRKDPLIKKLSSKAFNITVAMMTGLKLHDFNCGFKIYKNSVVKSIDVYGELHRFLPALAYQQGFKVTELKVQHHQRKFGESKYGRSGLKRARNYLLDPINVILITKYQYRPAHFFGNIGLSFLAIGIIINIYLSVLWLLDKGPIGNRPLLFLGILLIIIGIQLLSMGFLGELIVRENASDKNKDKYIKNK